MYLNNNNIYYISISINYQKNLRFYTTVESFNKQLSISSNGIATVLLHGLLDPKNSKNVTLPETNSKFAPAKWWKPPIGIPGFPEGPHFQVLWLLVLRRVTKITWKELVMS